MVDQRHDSPHGRRDLDVLLRYWPLVVGFVMVVLAYGELRFQLLQNTKDIAAHQATLDARAAALTRIERLEETDKAQWERIGALMNE